MRNIRQNLFFAFVYNTAGILVAAAALYPLLGVLLSPTIAAAAMSASSIGVITNALRLRRVKLDPYWGYGWTRLARASLGPAHRSALVSPEWLTMQ